MPSKNKRINLTIPENVYERIQKYKDANGIMNDASACYQLVIQQLNAFDNLSLVKKVISETSLDKLKALSAEGFDYLEANKDKLFAEKTADSPTE